MFEYAGFAIARLTEPRRHRRLHVRRLRLRGADRISFPLTQAAEAWSTRDARPSCAVLL